MLSHAPYRRVQSSRAGLRWWLFGRDRRHPLVIMPLVLVVLALAAFAALAWVWTVLGLLAAAGTGELAWRHGIPGFAWPIIVAAGLLATALFPPLLLVAGGAIGGAVVGNRRRERGQLPVADSLPQRTTGG